MFVTQYDRNTARTLAASIVAGAASPLTRGAATAETRVIDVGGGWHMSTWREQLRRLTDRSNVIALTVRTGPHEKRLSDADWAQVTSGLATKLGLTQRPWAAVRTGATTVAVLTDASGSVSRAAALEYIRQATIHLRRPAVGEPDAGAAANSSDSGAVQQAAPDTAAARGLAQLNFAASADSAPDAAAAAPSQPTSATQVAGRARGR